jgi:cytochrome c556
VTDRLSLTNALSNANIDRQAAERIATEIFDAIHDNVATKADLQVVEAALKADLQVVEAALKADLQRVEAALKADLQRVEADLQRVEAALRADLQRIEADLQRVEAALRADLQRIEASLKAELALRFSELEHRMTVRFGSVMVVLTGIVLAAIRYLPHS